MNMIRQTTILLIATVALTAATTACKSKPKKKKATAPKLEVGKFAYVNANKVRLRKQPSLKAKIVGVFPMGQKVKLTSTNGDWWGLKFGQYKGYIFGKFLSPHFVRTVSAMRSYVRGSYHLCSPDGSECAKGTLRLQSDGTYYQTFFKKKYGIIDRYSGKVDFSHDRVWLYPNRRLSRGLYYKRRALNGIDAVFRTTSEGALSPLGYSVRPGRKTLVVYECTAGGSQRLFLVPNTAFQSSRKISECALLEKAYLRKSSY